MFDSEVFLEDSGYLKFIAAPAVAGLLYSAARWYRLRWFSVWCLVLVLGNLALAGACFMFGTSVLIAEWHEISTDEALPLIVAMGTMFAAGVVCLFAGNVGLEQTLETRRGVMMELRASSVESKVDGANEQTQRGGPRS